MILCIIAPAACGLGGCAEDLVVGNHRICFTEICNDGQDNDCDDMVDEPGCQGMPCIPGAACEARGTCSASGLCERVVTELVTPDASLEGFVVAVDVPNAVVGLVGTPPSPGDMRPVWFYALVDGEWALSSELAGPQRESEFGHAVAIDGDLALVGAPEGDLGGAESGSAHLFQQDLGAWSEVQPLFETGTYLFAGLSVALANGRAFVGADDAVLVYEEALGWTRSATLVPVANSGRFPARLAASRDAVLTPNGGADGIPGTAIPFEHSAGTWNESWTFASPDGSSEGFAVDVDLDGAWLGISGTGGVYLVHLS